VFLVDHVGRYRRRYSPGASLLVPLGVAAGFVPFRTSFSNVGAALTLVVVIEVMAILGRRPGGIVATLSAAAWFDFFLTTPYERFTISHRPDLETTISLLVVGFVVTELAARSRFHRRAASEEGTYVSLLAATAVRAGTAVSPEQLLAAASEDLMSILSLRACHFEVDVSGPPHAQIMADGSVVHVGMRWPVSDIGIPGPQAEIPCVWHGSRLGRFILTPSPGLAVSNEQRVVAVALVNVVAGSLHDRRDTYSPPHRSPRG
jgi:hypothetical protein